MLYPDSGTLKPPQEERGAAVQASSRALEFTDGKTVRRFIVEAGRLDNIVTN